MLNEELQLLGHETEPLESNSWTTLALDYLTKGKYEEFILSEKPEKLTEIFSWKEEGLKNGELIARSAQATALALEYARSGSKAELELLLCTLGYFYAFLKANWTGPKLSLPAAPEAIQVEARTSLEVNGEECYRKIEYSNLFLRTKIWIEILPQLTLKSAPLWALRFLFYHQQLLENHAFLLKEKIDGLLVGLKTEAGAWPEKLQVKLWLEMGIVHHYFQERSKARESFVKAQTLNNFSVELTGALGKRTRFQTFETAQLVIKAKSSTATAAAGVVGPKEAENPDETLLPTPDFSEDIEKNNLDVVDQATLLALCLNVKNQNPKHGLTTEEMHPYVRKALEYSNNWLVHSMGLLIRTRLEVESTKTLERATLQVQALVDQFPLEEEAPVAERVKYIFLIAFPPLWRLKLETALLYGRIGSALSALQIFLELELFEHAVDCYRVTAQLEEAEKLCLQELERDPTNAKIYCLLGDVKGANYYLNKKEWQQANEHFELALAINPLFPDSWFSNGCAYMYRELWPEAVQSFTRCVQVTLLLKLQISPDEGQAWNNIGSIYLKMNNKRQAFTAFKEAVRHSRSNWRVWENYLFVSIDLQEWQVAIRVFHKLLDLQMETDYETLDWEILGILSQVAISDLGNGELDSVAKFFEPLLERVIATKTDVRLWRITGDYMLSKGELGRAIDAYLSLCRVAQSPGWEIDKEKFEAVAESHLKLAQAYEKEGSESSARSAKMKLRGLLKKSEDNWGTHPKYQEVEAMLLKFQY